MRSRSLPAGRRLFGPLFPALILLQITVTCNALAAQEIGFLEEDWEVIGHLTTITSASDGDQWLLFSTLDGLIGYDHFAHRLLPRGRLNAGLPSRRIYQVYQHPETLGIWVAHDMGISFRLPVDNYWRSVPSFALPDFYSAPDIIRLGGSAAGIWLDSGGLFTRLNALTGTLMESSIYPPDSLVSWNVSQSDYAPPPNLINWFGSGDWMVTVANFIGPGDLVAWPQFQIIDRTNRLWISTDLGILFVGDTFSRQLEEVKLGISPPFVTTAYRDGDLIWFAQNPLKMGLGSRARGEYYFLSAWDESAGRWRHYRAAESESIRGTGVNRMLRVGKELWLATTEGIVILNTRSGEWSFLGMSAGLSDPIVHDLVEFKGLVFAATRGGVSVFHPRKHTAVAEPSLALSPRVTVVDLHASKDALLAGTTAGIFEYKRGKGAGWTLISNLQADVVRYSEHSSYASQDRLLFRRAGNSGLFELLSLPVQIEGKILDIGSYGQYIWLATTSGVVVYDEQGDRHTTFRRRNGLPDGWVFESLPEEDWVWFITRGGVARFNWRPYFE
ncbi:MAG: hypothetical protein IIA59_00150 [Candidatus Marinimicrobia bacterium]|nr:hypothetical protein [Candidatus Neomarinimicrobiota bacterium]